MLTRTLGFGSTLVLVHLLTPNDFGLVALAFSISQGVEMLSVFGIEDAVVRHHAPDRAIYDTAYTLNAVRAIGTAFMIAVSAWPMAAFFGEPRLTVVVLSLAISTLLAGFQNIGAVDFRRNLTYGIEFQLRILPRLVSVAASLTIAFFFRTYWAIIVGTLVNRIATVLLTYRFHPYRPRLTLRAWRDLTGFSLWIWITGIVWLLRDRVGTFVIGRMLGIQSVGLFSMAMEVAVLPLSELMIPLTGVLFSTFSRASRDAQETVRLYLRFLGASALVVIPAGIGVAVIADPLTRLMLGPQWLSAIPVIQVMAACSPLAIISFISRSLFEARGIMSSPFKVTLVSALLRILLCVALAPSLGVLGVCIGAIATDLIDQVCLLTMTIRLLDISPLSVASQLWRPIVSAAAMAAGLLVAGLDSGWPGAGSATLLIELVVAASLGSALFFGADIILWLWVGSPYGAETDMLLAVRRTICSVTESILRLFHIVRIPRLKAHERTPH